MSDFSPSPSQEGDGSGLMAATQRRIAERHGWPVVHPEPGDREQRWVEAFSLQANEWDGDSVRVEDATAPLMALADAEVAAAVAAVRADTWDEGFNVGYEQRGYDDEQGCWSEQPNPYREAK